METTNKKIVIHIHKAFYKNLSKYELENILIDNFHRFVIYFQTKIENILVIEWRKSISSGLTNRISTNIVIVKSQII